MKAKPLNLHASWQPAVPALQRYSWRVTNASLPLHCSTLLRAALRRSGAVDVETSASRRVAAGAFCGMCVPPAPLSRPPPSHQPVHQWGKPSSGAFHCKKPQQPRAAAGLLVSPSRCWRSLGIKLSQLGWGCGSVQGGSAGGRATCCAAGRCGRCSWHFRQFSPSSPLSAVPSLPTHAHG